MNKIYILLFSTMIISPIYSQNKVKPANVKDIICFWDFNEKGTTPRISKTKYKYALKEGDTPIQRVEDGIFGRYSAAIEEGQWFYIPRSECPTLNIHGKDAQITLVAWVKRKPKSFKQCEAIAGIWNETNRKRQYCLFLNLEIWDSSQQVGGHISGVGGPTEGYNYCMDAAIGHTQVPLDEWQCIGFTYNGKEVCSYLNGKLDIRNERNPYLYELGLFDGGTNGGDFTVGAVNRSGEMGNFFVGQIGGLAVYNRALNSFEMNYLANNINKKLIRN